MKTPVIWGAGVAGLVASNVFAASPVLEKAPGPTPGGDHKALLRFRTPAVGEACGIDFRKVKVHKGIWGRDDLRGVDCFVQPNILLANQYSQKVVGHLADRSVWSLDPVERYVAPTDFYERLVERAGSRIHWGTEVGKPNTARDPVISTIPMPALVHILFGEHDPGRIHDIRTLPEFAYGERPEFRRAAIRVRRWIIPGADVYQTVYVPDPNTPVYRVSITGNLLIEEAMIRTPERNTDWFDAGEPFGVRLGDCEVLPAVSQSFGKIAPIDDAWRKAFIFHASHVEGIFSLGRFGTWRNILLDDVLHDCAVIKRLISEDAYGRSREMWR